VTLKRAPARQSGEKRITWRCDRYNDVQLWCSFNPESREAVGIHFAKRALEPARCRPELELLPRNFDTHAAELRE
jgi:hypothetical protein